MNRMDLKSATHCAGKPRCRRAWPTLLVAIFLLALVSPTPSDAQPYSSGRYNDDRRNDADHYGGERGRHRGEHGATVRCESTDQGYRHCRADTRDGVQLYRQLSKSACRYNDTWGYDRRGSGWIAAAEATFNCIPAAAAVTANRKARTIRRPSSAA